MDPRYFYMFLAFSIGVLIHTVIIEFSHKKKLFLDAQLKIQRVHKVPTPRIGGLGIFLACLFMIFNQELGQLLIISTIPVFIAGFVEDFTESASPIQRLLIMSLGTVFLFALLSWKGYFEFIPLRYLVPLFFILFLFINGAINGVNFIDGSNGLAAGSSLITTMGIALFAYIVKDFTVLYLAAILAVSILAFLIFNFPVAKIFLGDSGSYSLGFFLSALSLILLLRNYKYLHWMLIPVLLIYPLIEVGFSILRKAFFDKISPFSSDRNHFHQLVFRDLKNSKVYYPALSILPFQALAILLSVFFLNNYIVLFGICIMFSALYVYVYIYKRRKVYTFYKEMKREKEID